MGKSEALPTIFLGSNIYSSVNRLLDFFHRSNLSATGFDDALDKALERHAFNNAQETEEFTFLPWFS